MTLDGSAIPPLTDQPVKLGDTRVGEQLVTVWADRPARGLTRIMLADGAGRGCGDATLRGDTLTLTLPDDWSAADRTTATCLIAHLVHPVLEPYRQRHAVPSRAGEAPSAPEARADGALPQHADLLADPGTDPG